MSPEMIDGKRENGDSFALDWWTLGILAYELIIGFPPFVSKNKNYVKQAKIIMTKEPMFPDFQRDNIFMSDACKDFITSCLAKKEKDRLGSAKDVDEVMAHPWLKQFDIKELCAKNLKPDYIPNISRNKFDLKYFDQQLISTPLRDSVIPDQVS